MGLLELLGYVLLICIIGSVVIWLRRVFAPNIPASVDIAIGILCLVMVIIMMLGAIGVVPHDPKVPKLK